MGIIGNTERRCPFLIENMSGYFRTTCLKIKPDRKLSTFFQTPLLRVYNKENNFKIVTHLISWQKERPLQYVDLITPQVNGIFPFCLSEKSDNSFFSRRLLSQHQRPWFQASHLLRHVTEYRLFPMSFCHGRLKCKTFVLVYIPRLRYCRFIFQ